MTARVSRPALLRAVIVAVTVVFTALALVVGQGTAVETVVLETGQPAPQTFTSTRRIEVVDAAATEAAKSSARLNVETQYAADPSVTAAVLSSISQVFTAARQAAAPIPAPTVSVPGDAVVIDPGVVEPVAEATTPTEPTTVESTPVEEQAPADGETETTVPSTTTTLATTTTSTTLPRPGREEQLVALTEAFPLLAPSTLATMVEILNDDFERDVVGGGQFFEAMEREALQLARDLLQSDGGILAEDLGQVRTELVSSPPFLLLPGIAVEDRRSVEVAIADLVATFLQSNRRIDQVATDQLREEAEAAVTTVTRVYVPDETIVAEGALLTRVHLDAIEELGLLQPEEGPPLEAMALAAAIAVLLAAFFLRRVARRQWQRPKLVALFGLLVVLAALAARIPELMPTDRPELLYLVPAPVFGYLATILFDSRTAALLAIPVATFAGLATGDVGVTIFAAGAAMAPVPFVSSVSSRTQLRFAVAYSALAMGPLAATVAWFFGSAEAGRWAAAAGFGNGIVSGVVALGVLPFLENLFRITTTLTLLDLTDRNHPALRRIEEEAPGTFNHSILVGTLAGKAARAIGANTLLAQAAAYYHDLGKTVQPQYFIENQFGVSNPHDDMDPVDSAVLIRAHVSDGLRLARQYGIPADVAAGIRMHHGTGLMRYFYHRALGDDPGTDPELFRHHGEKPRAKEMAILMLSDAVEGATRALVQHEDPTSAGIAKLVEQVIAEKVEDGQLDDSALTFGELTKVKEALVEALIAYYHTRIPYPGFPGRAATGVGG